MIKTLNRRIKALIIDKTRFKQAKPLPLVVDEHTTDAEIERLKRTGRAVFRSGDPALYDEFV
jgi:hypothetical protein